MSFGLLASLVAVNTAGPTPPMDTSLADLLLVINCWDNRNGLSGAVTDNKSDTWTIGPTSGVGDLKVQVNYSWNPPNVGAGHTFSANIQFGAVMHVLAFRGARVSGDPVDKTNGANTASGTSFQTGSVAPSENNELIITAMVAGIGTAGYNCGSGFTNLFENDFHNDPGGNQGAALSYKIQTAAAPENPTWSWTGTGSAGGTIVTFRSSDGSGLALPFRLSVESRRA